MDKDRMAWMEMGDGGMHEMVEKLKRGSHARSEL